MFFAYVLYDLGNTVVNVGGDLVRLGAGWLGVYLIGSYIAIPTIDFGNRVIFVGSQIVGAGRAWEGVYNEIRNGVSFPDILRRLADWGDRIIDVISNIDNTIISIVRSAFSGIEEALRSTYSFILPHVLRIIYDRFPALKSLITWLTDNLNILIPNFGELRYDPVKWVVNRLKVYSQALGKFLSDPDGYIKEKLYVFFPSLRQFLENPTEYIMDKLGEKLEIFANRYLIRLIKIVENALNEIF